MRLFRSSYTSAATRKRGTEQHARTSPFAALPCSLFLPPPHRCLIPGSLQGVVTVCSSVSVDRTGTALVSARLLCMTLLHSLTYATSPS